jgi:hypothetical protein
VGVSVCVLCRTYLNIFGSAVHWLGGCTSKCPRRFLTWGEIHQYFRIFLKGLSTRVRIAIRIAVRFRARFLRKQNRDPIIFLSPIKMVRFHIFSQKNQKITCWTPLAANRTPNRMGIRMENRTCRQPLTQILNAILNRLRIDS